MNEQQFISESMQQELAQRIQAAQGNIAVVRQEVEKQLQRLGAEQATQAAQSPEARVTNGEIALLRSQLLYLDSLVEQQKRAKSSTGRRYGGSTDPAPVGFGDKWRAAQPTKTHLVWSVLAAVVLTLIVGFTWGGWMTASAAQKMADTEAKAAVVQRLAPICVAQFNQDPDRDLKLQEMGTISSYQRAEYVRTQGWATISGSEQPDRKVADECVKLLMQIEP